MDAASVPVRALSRPRPWAGFFLVTGAALALRVAVLAFVSPTAEVMMNPDSRVYVETAVNLADHGTFAAGDAPAFVPEFNRTPGYPLFLVPFLRGGAPSFPALLWAQAVIGAATAGLLFLFVSGLGATRSQATAAGLALGLDLVAVVYGVYVATEAVFLPLWVLATGLIVMAHRRGSVPAAAGAGLALALAAFVRPIALYYPIVAAPFLLFSGRAERRRRVLMTATFLLTAMALPFCWSARNRSVAGAWLFSTNGQQNFFYFRAAMMDMKRFHLSQPEAVSALETKFRSDRPGPYPSDAAATLARGRWAVGYLFRNLPAYFPVLANGSAKLLFGNGAKALVGLVSGDDAYRAMEAPLVSGQTPGGEAASLAGRHRWTVAVMILYSLYLAALYCGAARGFLRVGRSDGWTVAWLLALPAVYALGLGAGPEAFSRIRLPAMPALSWLAALGWAIPRKK